jgi:hypothetical protein
MSTLDTVTDLLNGLLEAAEQRLEEMAHGVPADVPLDEEKGTRLDVLSARLREQTSEEYVRVREAWSAVQSWLNNLPPRREEP